MTATNLSPAYDIFLEFVEKQATPQAILEFKLPPEEERRAIELLELSNAGTLTPEQALELQQMQQVNQLVSVLKARALAAMNRA